MQTCCEATKSLGPYFKRVSGLFSAGRVRDGRAGLSPVRLLVAAAVFHLLVTVCIFELGRHEVLPDTFDRNGLAISFAPDSANFLDDVIGLSDQLRRGEVAQWLSSNYSLHLRLYSVCFAALGPWLGYNIISAELLNLSCYLAILTLVFYLGREIFSRRAGVLAAVAVALWPSFLIHSTQLLRDPLFIMGMLALLYVIARWLTQADSWRAALLAAAAGGAAVMEIWLTRANMWEVMLATVVIGCGLLALRQFGRRVQVANLVGMALTVTITVGVILIVPKFNTLGDTRLSAIKSVFWTFLPPDSVRTIQPAAAPSPSGPLLAEHIANLRRKFIRTYPGSGSNIDTDVQFGGLGDIIRYLPRAAAIGFLAPFPNMWFTSGKQVGSTGRLLVGAESLVMYAVEGLAAFGLWLGRRRLNAWFIFSVAAIGMTSLGLVVVNVGALYRMRYLFLLMMIILAAHAATRAPVPGREAAPKIDGQGAMS